MAFPTGWSYKRQISIDSGQKSGSPTGIVLTITEDSGLADANGPLDADGTAPAQNGGGDLRVSSDSAGANQIPLDVVSFVTDNDHTAAKCELKVNFDDLSSDAFYLWWGTEGTESQPAVTDTYGRNAVYSSGNHLLVYSMDEDPSGASPQITDRTGNGYDGTSSGSMTSGDVVSGQVGSAIDFDGTDDRIDSGSTLSAITESTDWSISCWSSPNLISTDQILAATGWGQNEYGWLLRVTSTNAIRFGMFTIGKLSGGQKYKLRDSGAISNGVFSRFTGLWSSSGDPDVRVNGSLSNGSLYSATPLPTITSTKNANVGATPDTANRKWYDGPIDNVVIYTRKISGDDDTTLYNCESDNAAFWSVGSVESPGGGGSSIVPHVMYYKRMMAG